MHVRNGVIALVALAGLAAAAEAGPIYGFSRITANASTDVASQLTVEVNDAGTSMGYQLVDFIFRNEGPSASSITGVYFADGTLLGIVQIVDSGSGVSFSQGASPANLPGGNAIGFVTTAGFAADSDPPVQPNGVNPGEWLRIRFALQAGKDYQDTLDALQLGLDQGGVTGALRIGLHVQGIVGGQSDSFVNGTPISVVPLPTAGAMALAGLGIVARRRRRPL
jgi:hypothetical protein